MNSRRPTNGKGTPELQLDTLDLKRAPALLAAAGALLPPRTGMALTVGELRYGDNSLGAACGGNRPAGSGRQFFNRVARTTRFIS